MIAFLFPGQGSQRPRLLADCVASFDADALFASASDVLRTNVLNDDDASALERPEIVQRNVFLAGMAGARALEAAGVVPHACAGHSIGAFVAATVAGVLSFPDALRVVSLRGKAMAEALGAGHGMGAVLGLSEHDVRAIVTSVRSEAIVDIAAVNARDQIVVSGSDAGVDLVLATAALRGARNVRRLDVPVASHTPQLDGVRGRLAIAFETLATARPRMPVAANIDGRALLRASDVASDLIEGVAKPVRWHDATQMLYERGATCFVEPFFGDTLTALAETAFPETPAVSIGRAGVSGTVAFMKRYG